MEWTAGPGTFISSFNNESSSAVTLVTIINIKDRISSHTKITIGLSSIKKLKKSRRMSCVPSAVQTENDDLYLGCAEQGHRSQGQGCCGAAYCGQRVFGTGSDPEVAVDTLPLDQAELAAVWKSQSDCETEMLLQFWSDTSMATSPAEPVNSVKVDCATYDTHVWHNI